MDTAHHNYFDYLAPRSKSWEARPIVGQTSDEGVRAAPAMPPSAQLLQEQWAIMNKLNLYSSGEVSQKENDLLDSF